MKLALGIPDDSPENTVRTILQILKEEAGRVGASFNPEPPKVDGIWLSCAVYIKLKTKTFHIALQWANLEDLPATSGGIGSGFMSPNWTLLLLSGPREGPLGWNPADEVPTPPFRWGVYTEARHRQWDQMPPSFELTGGSLRRELCVALEIEPPA